MLLPLTLFCFDIATFLSFILKLFSVGVSANPFVKSMAMSQFPYRKIHSAAEKRPVKQVAVLFTPKLLSKKFSLFSLKKTSLGGYHVKNHDIFVITPNETDR